MAVSNLQEKILRWRDKIQHCDSSDPINGCPASALQLLSSCPAALIKLSHSKIHSYQYDQVPTCWRRLFTDASICEALVTIDKELKRLEREDGNECEEPTQTGTSPFPDEKLQEVVGLLDRAQIIAGAPERDQMIEHIQGSLQTFTDGEEDLRPSKKRKTDFNVFPKVGLNVPEIKHPMVRITAPSMAEFERRLDDAQPFILTGTLTHWPAFHEHPWHSASYLLKKTFGGRRLIPVELGRSYTDTGWGQAIMTFKEFITRFVLDPDPSAKEQNGREVAYLAQHDLFAQIPSLRNDISVPDYCYTDPPPPTSGTPLAAKPAPLKLEEPLLNAWFGPAGTVSPLHTDPYHNILCQVVGRKYVRLYSPFDTVKLYPRTTGDGNVDMSNTSQVDAEGEEAEIEKDFPLFKEAKYVEMILEEGEALYVPVGWWHYIRSLDVSFSVSFWWN